MGITSTGRNDHWLCVTNQLDKEEHFHLCGTHVKPYMRHAGVVTYIITTIDPLSPDSGGGFVVAR